MIRLILAATIAVASLVMVTTPSVAETRAQCQDRAYADHTANLQSGMSQKDADYILDFDLGSCPSPKR